MPHAAVPEALQLDFDACQLQTVWTTREPVCVCVGYNTHHAQISTKNTLNWCMSHSVYGNEPVFTILLTGSFAYELHIVVLALP